MDGARLPDGLITTEFSFIQELIWSPPYKNPFPLCSQSILSRLENLRGEWRRASPAAHQSAMSLIEDLDADIKVLIELRKRFLKRLTCKDSTADASTNSVYLAQKVDSILVQHLKNSWKEQTLKLTDTDIQKHKNIDQDCLTADVLQLFVLDAPHQCQGRNKDGIAEENSTVPEADCQENNAGKPSVEKDFSAPQGQPLPASVERSPATSEQDLGFHIRTNDSIKDAGRLSATGATNSTLQEMICTSNADENSFQGLGMEEELCVFTTKPDVTTTSSECDALKAILSTSIHVQPALATDDGPHFSIITPDAVNDSGSRGTIGTLQRFHQIDQDSTATSKAKPNQFIEKTEDMEDDVEQAAASLEELSSCSATDEYFSASSNDEHDTMIKTGSTKIRDYNSQIPEFVTGVNGAASPVGANGSEISEVQRFPPWAGPACPREIQIFSSTRNTNGALTIDENDLRKSPSGRTARVTAEEKNTFEGNCSEELVEVEMTFRAKICEPESEEPYWHVMFALLNYSNFKVSVQKLEYWSLDKQEDNVKSVYWDPGEMILREQPSFLCHSIKVPFSASNASPRLAFSWQYSKLPEWIPTQNGKPKLEKGTVRKRFRNTLSFGNAEEKFKHNTGHVSWKSTKKRTRQHR